MGRPSKKLSLFRTLEILKINTDEDHRLSQNEILGILYNDYNISIDRRTIKSNLMDLIDLGYDIEFEEISRMLKNKKTGETEENNIMTNIYLNRRFTNSELRLLIDSLLFSRHLPSDQCKKLILKLETLSNKYFKSRMEHIYTMPEDKTNNHQIFFNIDLLDEAIQKKKKVSFKYLEYGIDKKQHVKCRENGEERVYIVSPYQMAAREGKYYLICNYDKYEDVSNYRIDRITEIKILDEKSKPFEKLKWSNGHSFNLSEYMKNHIYICIPVLILW